MQDPQDHTSKPAETSPLPPTDAVQAPAWVAQDNWARETLEKLAFANLKEQRSDRRWKLGLRLAWMGIAIFVIWQIFSFGSPASSPSFAHTALVTIVGEISSDTEASAENVMSSMRTALEDPGSRALVLLIN